MKTYGAWIVLLALIAFYTKGILGQSATNTTQAVPTPQSTGEKTAGFEPRFRPPIRGRRVFPSDTFRKPIQPHAQPVRPHHYPPQYYERPALHRPVQPDLPIKEPSVTFLASQETPKHEHATHDVVEVEASSNAQINHQPVVAANTNVKDADIINPIEEDGEQQNPSALGQKINLDVEDSADNSVPAEVAEALGEVPTVHRMDHFGKGIWSHGSRHGGHFQTPSVLMDWDRWGPVPHTHVTRWTKQPILNKNPHASFVHFTAGQQVLANHHSQDLLDRFHYNRPLFADAWDRVRSAEPTTQTQSVAGLQVLRVANRPSEVIIRNTFRENPRTWVDLRISIDENGVLNVEAGPQARGVNSTQSMPGANGAGVEEPKTQPMNAEDMDLEQHWKTHRQSRGLPTLTHVSGVLHHQTTTEDNAPSWQTHNTRVHERVVPVLSSRSHWNVMGTSHPPVTSRQVEQQQQQQQTNSEHDRRPEPNHREQSEAQPKEKPAEDHKPIQSAAASSSMIEANLKRETSNNNANIKSQEQTRERQSVEDKVKALEKEAEEVTPVKEEINIDDFSHSGCPKQNCEKRCAGNLFKLNLANGCPTCDCCPEVVCQLHCEKGFDSDDHGCPACRCIE